MLVSEIRDVTAADLDAVDAIFRRSSLSNVGDRANLLAHPELLEFPNANVRGAQVRVAVADGRVVGFATTMDSGGALELDDLFVDPDWMRRGVGRALVLDAMATARANGVPRIEVTANAHALEFYEKVGFVVFGTATTQFGSSLRIRLDVTP